MIDKKLQRKRRALRARMKMRELNITRLCINRTAQHIYAQLIIAAPKGDKTIISASTLDKEVKAAGGTAGNIKSATVVGNVIAKRAIANGIKKIAFDRSGYKYHGCVKALAEAAREAGLEF